MKEALCGLILYICMFCAFSSKPTTNCYFLFSTDIWPRLSSGLQLLLILHSGSIKRGNITINYWKIPFLGSPRVEHGLFPVSKPVSASAWALKTKAIGISWGFLLKHVTFSGVPKLQVFTLLALSKSKNPKDSFRSSSAYPTSLFFARKSSYWCEKENKVIYQFYSWEV